MITKELIQPRSIVVIGASNDIKKPGGKMLKNLLDGEFSGALHVVHPKESKVQGITTHSKLKEIPQTDLAILAIPAKHCLETVRVLTEEKNTKAFIIISAGFAEAGNEKLEKDIVSIIDKANACLIGPNCIGVINEQYKGVFSSPIPEYHSGSCDLISSSGATAVFIMEAGIPLGIKFANIFSVGNAAQNGVEDVLEYMDEHYNPESDAPIKLLYMEAIRNPKKLLKHAASLIRKGAKIAAIKAGSTAEGSRAASSHTGAIASSDVSIRALFKKAGIVYCSSREELLSVASIFTYKKLEGKNIAIITHAGGSAVMLTDVLSKGGLNIPSISGKAAKELETYLFPGSSVGNPIDFLATGTAEQLGIIIDYCEHKFDHIDAMVVVFGSPGLFDVENVYNVLSVKLDICKKAIFPVLPSVINARKEIQTFLDKGNVNFPDEVVLGKALSQVYKTPKPISETVDLPEVDNKQIRQIIDRSKDGYLDPQSAAQLLDAAKIPRAKELVESCKDSLIAQINSSDYPIVMKVIGPLHKSDSGGVILNVKSPEELSLHFDSLMKIENAEAVMVQKMYSGLELFVGAKKEIGFQHTILCGLGGIYIEILKDVCAGLSPLSEDEASEMIRSLKSYKIIQGARGKEGIDEALFTEIILRISALVEAAPEIVEMDINPLMANKNNITAVDVRIRVEK